LTSHGNSSTAERVHEALLPFWTQYAQLCAQLAAQLAAETAS
jgi:hypothetical protein